MRSLQVLMCLLCAFAGASLLLDGPVFFLPARDPALGLRFDPAASRLLGAGLLALAATGLQYLHAMYYGGGERLRSEKRAQQRYFLSLVLALALLASALWRSEAGPNPEFRPPSSLHAP